MKTFLSFLFIAICTSALAADTTKEAAYGREDLIPFWRSKTMRDESVLFVRESQSQEASATLLSTPTKILSVKSSSGEITYKEGRDYRLEKGTGAVVVPPGSTIPVKADADLTRAPGTQAYRLTRRDGKGEILFGPGHEYHDMQVVVTYTHRKNEWKIPPAQFAGRELPLALQKLKDRKPISIVLFGDSISTGCNASKWANTAPFQPFYGDLLVQKLKSVYRSNISLTNFSVGGMTSGWGSQNIQQVAAVRPDLAILAWGMNDRCSPEEFIANLQTQMAEVRKANPQTEFILVATMLPNGEWTAMNPDRQIAYRDAMLKLVGPGVAVADVTAVWEGMLKRKKHFDITGNGVNHPNDFGHRLYAQVILALLEK